MTKVRKTLLVAAFAALATLTVGGASAFAHGTHTFHHDDPGTLHRDCTWSVTKSASTTSLTLSVGQVSAPVTYTITVSATCVDSHHDEHGDHHAHDGAVDGHVLHPEHTPNHGTDLCVAVSDPKAPGPLFGDGQVCESELVHGSISTTYTRTFGPFNTCGAFTDTNTVTVSDLHGTVLAHASATVHINVPCVTGCTLTQGYWKTHSARGPAPFDDNWNNLPDQPAAFDPDAIQEAQDETFFYSGQTWYQVFWTPPAGGNVYYQLAHQYMAAVLNKLNGASSTAAVDAAIAAATTYFNNAANTPSSALNLSKSAKQTLQGYASTLASYNEGAIGPGHCDE